MKVIVLGAGVVGVTTAYYAARAGHDVTVIDRRAGPALETSFANAGEISPGYASPWAAPGVPLKALKWLFMKDAPFAIQISELDPNMVRWALSMLRNCTASRYAVNKARMVSLATFSRDRLRELRAVEGIDYDHRSRGTLQLFRSQKQLDAAAKDIEVLKAGGIDHELLDTDGCLRVEPGLATAVEPILGGLRLPGDETGDCFAFTTSLARIAERIGVTFRWNTTIDRLAEDAGRVTATIDGQRVEADAFVLACGSWSPGLAKPLGLLLPIYPIKGYSITLPKGEEAATPQSTLLDETFKVAITRLGDRVRVGGMAELAGFDKTLRPERQRILERSVFSLFPGLAASAERSLWAGFRPMTPDSVPLVGPTRFKNLWLNTGHGTLGWTMSCGSACLIADQISGRSPAEEMAWAQGLNLVSEPVTVSSLRKR